MRKLVLSAGLAFASTTWGLSGEALAQGNPVPPAFHVSWAGDVGDAGSQFIVDNALGPELGFLSGEWRTTLDFHDGQVLSNGDINYRSFIAAIDRTGAPIWHRSIEGVAFGRLAATSEDDVIVAGSRVEGADVGCGPIPQAGGFLAKFSGATGQCQWMRIWPATGNTYGMSSVRVLPDGDIAVAGVLYGAVDLGNGVSVPDSNIWRSFVARLDPRGHGRWIRIFTQTQNLGALYLGGLASDATGQVVVTGAFNNEADLDGELVTAPPSPDPGYGGTITAFFVVALDPEGEVVWRYVDTATALSTTGIDSQAGRLAVTGTTPNIAIGFAGTEIPASDDAAASRLVVLDFSSTDGHQRWAKAFDGSGVKTDGVVRVDQADRVHLVCGFYDGPLDTGIEEFQASGLTRPVFMAVLDGNTGAITRENSLVADGHTIQNLSFSLGNDGFQLLTGDFAGTLPAGKTVLTSTPDQDISHDAFYLSLVK